MGPFYLITQEARPRQPTQQITELKHHSGDQGKIVAHVPYANEAAGVDFKATWNATYGMLIPD